MARFFQFCIIMAAVTVNLFLFLAAFSFSWYLLAAIPVVAVGGAIAASNLD